MTVSVRAWDGEPLRKEDMKERLDQFAAVGDFGGSLIAIDTGVKEMSSYGGLIGDTGWIVTGVKHKRENDEVAIILSPVTEVLG